MKNILQQLYNGEIFPAESMPLKVRNTVKSIRGITTTTRTLLSYWRSWSRPLDKRFIKIMDEQLDVIPFEFSEMFIDGFKLGAKMMAEVFRDE